MTRQELEEKLIAEDINPVDYSLYGGLPNEAFCLNKTNGKWEVYYSERGNKTGLKVFSNENEACMYFYNELMQL